ncbi:MAG: neutral/alkaline non-lysosomal ceramidase N-terminal domain-containing protein, partial [Deltaproteobacteria bacterium]|nr:neutral/alkaline non-lysosomal ceramidase N-terminal domain-containing protein [Deltaproteobacteria bacterium]
MSRLACGRAAAWVLCLVAACNGGSPASPDANDTAVSTDNCTYEPMPATANATGTVTAGPLSAGAAESVIAAPVGSALGGYSARAGFLGAGTKTVDNRKVPISGSFYPSIGVETAPRAKALALTAGGETVVIVHMDAIFVYEGMVFDLEEKLGAEYHGKVLVAASHSHSAWSQFTGHDALQVGAGRQRDIVYQAELAAAERAAKAALAARRPAKIGFFADANFDPTDQISHQRRGENDALPGGDKKDVVFHLIRVDGTDGQPIAIVPIHGVHGTLNSEENPLASTDSTGAMERAVQEQFDRPVVVMHLQSAGADVSPSGHGSLDCDNHPGDPADPCLEWLTSEGHGRAAAPVIMAAWTAAGASMQDAIELEMVSRSIETGPKPETFTIRNGALSYAPFDLARNPDGVVMAGDSLASPVDEYNAPVGAALCETDTATFPAGAMPGTEGIPVFGSCVRLDVAASVLGEVLDLDFNVDERHPVCSTTRTTISALRLGDTVIGTLPGEVSVLLADLARTNSPVDAAHTIVVGYAQGHVGYMLRPEDWVLGGYEPSVTFWGPLEAEYIEEQLAKLWPLAMTPTREDAAAAGATKLATKHVTDDLVVDDPAPMAGTVPATVPAETWLRAGVPASAQPLAQVPRVSGLATFVFHGDDPLIATPKVTLQRETASGSGAYVDVTRHSGRVVDDGDFLLATTPQPLIRAAGGSQTHLWALEWQAVPWLGEVGLDDLGKRAALPLGKYRFHVIGKSWTLDSQPFEVVAGGLAGSATRNGPLVSGVATLSA